MTTTTIANETKTASDEDVQRAETQVRQLEDRLAEAKRLLRELRGTRTKAKSAPRECTCGCGGITSGGMFLPGHDAKMRSRLLAEIRDGASEESEREALATLRSFPGLAHDVSEYDLGKVRRDRAEKESRKAQAKADKTARETEAERLKAAAQRLKDASRKQTNEAADATIAQKERAIADAKANGMPANVAK